MNLWVPQSAGLTGAHDWLAACHERFCSMESVSCHAGECRYAASHALPRRPNLKSHKANSCSHLIRCQIPHTDVTNKLILWNAIRRFISVQLLDKLPFPFTSRPYIDLLSIILTNSMEQSPYWEASSCSANQEISRIVNGTRNFITFFTKPRYLYLSWARSFQSTPSHLTSLKHLLLLPSHLRLYLPSCLFSSGSLTKSCMLFSSRALRYPNIYFPVFEVVAFKGVSAPDAIP